jgi:PAS domain-containing protein
MEGALAGETQLFERAIPTPSGEVRHTQASYIPDVVDGEVRGFFVLVTDISETKRMEREAEQSRARLATAERVAGLGSWEWDVETGEIVWSDGLYAIYGVSREEFEPEYETGGSKYVHPKDRDRVAAEVRRALENGASFDFEYRIIRPDGHLYNLLEQRPDHSDPAPAALELALAETQDAHQALWDGLNRNERLILLAVGDGQAPTGNVVASEHRVARSTLQEALERLLADERHLKRDAGGKPYLLDPLLGRVAQAPLNRLSRRGRRHGRTAMAQAGRYSNPARAGAIRRLHGEL